MDSGADVTVKDVDLRSCVKVAVGDAETMAVLLQVRICTLVPLCHWLFLRDFRFQSKSLTASASINHE